MSAIKATALWVLSKQQCYNFMILNLNSFPSVSLYLHSKNRYEHCLYNRGKPISVHRLKPSLSLVTRRRAGQSHMTIHASLYIRHRSPKRPVPRWLHTTILCYLSRVVCVRTQASSCRSVTRKVYVKSTKKTKTMTSTEGNGNMEDVELVKLTVNAKAEVDHTYTNYSKQKTNSNNTQNSEQEDNDEPPD